MSLFRGMKDFWDGAFGVKTKTLGLWSRIQGEAKVVPMEGKFERDGLWGER